MTDLPYSPFANGTQWMDWQESNCCSCTKYKPDGETGATCDLEWELSLGGETGDGSVSAATAKRMGYLQDDGTTDRRYVWPCAIVEWTEAHKERIARKRGYASAAEMVAAQAS